MLDYDAMRAKVRKLVEKPDKDPAKLPRTEKETEMVSMTDFLKGPGHDSPLDLSLHSPPKALDTFKRVEQLQQEDEDMVRRHGGWSAVSKSPSVVSRIRSSPRLGSGRDEAMLQRSSSATPRPSSIRAQSTTFRLPAVRESSSEALLQRSNTNSRHSSSPASTPSASSLLTVTPATQGVHKRVSALSPSPSTMSSFSSNQKKQKTTSNTNTHTARTTAATPFFHPSELEQLMQPLREEYIRTQTNAMAQAKAAYDQLNEQLTSELPQLIDLR